MAVVGRFLRGLGRWSDEYEVRVFHFGKMCEAAGTEHPSTLRSMNKLTLVLRNQGKYEGTIRGTITHHRMPPNTVVYRPVRQDIGAVRDKSESWVYTS
jgi:hypothetical protein